MEIFSEVNVWGKYMSIIIVKEQAKLKQLNAPEPTHKLPFISELWKMAV